MQIYLVGGAVRDELLDLPVTERDWVVVGGSADDLLARGFRQVGKDFPVFLDPDHHEEYALARTERKTAPGYHGFSFQTGETVTLEQDLQRRDLTINAMARSGDGRLVDPWGGLADLRARRLRHVSPAFAEDPVRIIRVARFAARLQPLGFRVADETMALMRAMVDSGEVDALVPERVWQELRRALQTPSPSTFVRVLRECGALAVILPEVDRLFGIPQPERHHPEIDTGEHLLLCLDQVPRLGGDAEVGFAVLCHDLGKASTPAEQWPAHHRHEHLAAPLIESLCERLRVPRASRELALLAARLHVKAHRALELRARTLVGLLDELDAWRRPERFEKFLLACEADARGRAGSAERPYPQAERLRRALAAGQALDLRRIAAACADPKRIAATIRRARIQAVEALRDGAGTGA